MQRSDTSVTTSVFRKPSNSNRFIPFQSFHHHSHKTAAIYSLTHRAVSHCSSPELRGKELKFIHQLFLNNGFPSATITSIIANVLQKTGCSPQPRAAGALAVTGLPEDCITISLPFIGPLFYTLQRIAKKFGVRIVPRSISSIHSVLGTPKHKLPHEQHSGIVYGIHCSCGQLYIGQTGREVQTRKTEHEQTWNKGTGAFLNHPKPNHQPQFHDIHILTEEKSHEIREIKEAMLILQGGDNCIENTNMGQRSTVNRNRGLNLDPHWIQIVNRFSKLPSIDLHT